MSEDATTTAAVPSTPARPITQNQAPPPSTSRRSTRVHKRDPVVAPGFGTQQDLVRLSEELGLPLEAAKAIMESRGRGLRRGKRGGADDEESSATPKVVSTAWADFLQEEHTDEKDSKKAGAAEDEAAQEREYALPLKPTWASDGKPKAKKSKTSEDSGVVVQCGTLDSSCVGRTKTTLDRSYDLTVPTVLLPKIQITKVFSSCNSVHALCVDTSGKLYGWGRNEAGQLGSSLPKMVGKPVQLEIDHDIVEAAVGKSHSVVLTASHEMFAVGSNKVGQCGIKSSVENVPNFRKCVTEAKIVQVSANKL